MKGKYQNIQKQNKLKQQNANKDRSHRESEN